MEDIRAYLTQFVAMNEEEWSALSYCFRKQILSKKSYLLREGEICDFVAFIHDGAFRYYHVKEGVEKVTGFFFPQNTVSDYSSFLSQTPSRHFIEAIADSTVYKLYKRDLLELYDRFPTIERIGRLVAEGLFLSVDKRLNSFLFMSPEERYHELVSRNPQLVQQVPQYMIASYLGVEPETLSRIRRRNR